MRVIHKALPPFLASICLIFFVFLSADASEQETIELQVADFGKAPNITYMVENGSQKTLDVSGHRLTALHFWATWCVPCVDEMPMLSDAQKIFGEELHIIPIALDGKKTDKVQEFMKVHAIANLPVLLDPSSNTFRQANLKGLPGTLFINSEGQVIARADGPLDWQHESVVSFIKGQLKD